MANTCFWIVDLNVICDREKKGREWGDIWTSSGNLQLKGIIGGVQWRALNTLPTKWLTVYLRGQIGQTVSNYPSIEGKDFLLLLFFSFLLFFPVCVREQHRSNSPTSGLCWPSSALDTGCFRRDRPHPLSPLWARSRHHSPGRKNIHSEKRASRTRIHILPGILSIRLIEWTSLILNASPCSWQGYHWQSDTDYVCMLAVHFHCIARVKSMAVCHIKCALQLSKSLRTKCLM